MNEQLLKTTGANVLSSSIRSGKAGHLSHFKNLSKALFTKHAWHSAKFLYGVGHVAIFTLRATRENTFLSSWCHPLKIKVIITVSAGNVWDHKPLLSTKYEERKRLAATQARLIIQEFSTSYFDLFTKCLS